MEGSEHRALGTRLHAGGAFRHLARGLVGKGYREDRLGLYPALANEPGDLGRDDARLSGARARENQKRRALVGYRLKLFRIKD